MFTYHGTCVLQMLAPQFLQFIPVVTHIFLASLLGITRISMVYIRQQLQRDKNISTMLPNSTSSKFNESPRYQSKELHFPK